MIIASLALATLLAQTAPPEVTASRNFRFEPYVSYMLTSQFQENDGEERQSDTEQTFIAGAKMTWRLNPERRLRLDSRFGYRKYEDLTASNHPRFQASLALLLSENTRFEAKARYIGERILFVTFRDERVLHSDSRLAFSVKHMFRQVLSAKLGVEADREDYIPAFHERDSRTNALKLRLELHAFRYVTPRVAYEIAKETASSTNYSKSEREATLGVTITPPGPVTVYLRARFKDKDYDAVDGDKNFQRKDDVRDLLVEARWEISDGLDLSLHGFHRSGESSRPGKDFTGGRLRFELRYSR